MVNLVGKTKSAPTAATPENSDPSGSRATVILKGNRFGADNCCGATADERPMRVRLGATTGLTHRSKFACAEAAWGPFKEFGLVASRSQPELFAGFQHYSAKGTPSSIRGHCLAVRPEAAPTDQLNHAGSHGGLV